MEDRQLIRKTLDGNSDAFGLIYEKYFSKIYGMIYRTLEIHPDTEDLVQDIFVAVVENLKKFDPKYHFSTWIFSIARNKLNDYLRIKYKNPLVRMDNDQMDVIELEVQIHTSNKLPELLSSLDNVEKEMINKRYLLNWKFTDIADDLGITTNNVKVKHNRIIKKLKKKYEKSK